MKGWALLLLLLQCCAAQAGWRQLGPGLRMLEIGPFDTGSYINLNIARDMALISRDGAQYTAYYNPQGRLIAAKRPLDSDHFETHEIPCPLSGTSVLSDPHHFVSIQMDGDGYLHMAYNHHNSAMHYRRSSKPREIQAWEPERGLDPKSAELAVTYVSFIRLKSGSLLAMFRVGRAGLGDEELMRYDLKARAWSKLAWPLLSGGGKSSPYLWRPLVSPDGNLHLAWTWRFSKFEGMPDSPWLKEHFSGFSDKDILYACSHDEGRSWQRSDGRPYALPISNGGQGAHEPERILDLPMGEDFFNHYGSDYGPDGQPHFAYSRWNNGAQRIAQQWEIYHGPAGWKVAVVSDYKHGLSWTHPQQDGLASTDLARPSLLMDKSGRTLLLSRSHERGDLIELFSSPPGDAGPWSRQVLFDGSTGGWEPQMDLDLWHQSGGRHLQLLLAGITDRDIFELRGRPNNFIEKIKSLYPWRHRSPWDYYPQDFSIQVLKADPRLRENTGYLLDVDLGELRAEGIQP